MPGVINFGISIPQRSQRSVLSFQSDCISTITTADLIIVDIKYLPFLHLVANFIIVTLLMQALLVIVTSDIVMFNVMAASLKSNYFQKLITKTKCFPWHSHLQEKLL